MQPRRVFGGPWRAFLIRWARIKFRRLRQRSLPEGIRRTSLSSSNGMMPAGCEPRWLMDFWHWRFARLVLHPEIVAHSDQLGRKMHG